MAYALTAFRSVYGWSCNGPRIERYVSIVSALFKNKTSLFWGMQYFVPSIKLCMKILFHIISHILGFFPCVRVVVAHCASFPNVRTSFVVVVLIFTVDCNGVNFERKYLVIMIRLKCFVNTLKYYLAYKRDKRGWDKHILYVFYKE